MLLSISLFLTVAQLVYANHGFPRGGGGGSSNIGGPSRYSGHGGRNGGNGNSGGPPPDVQPPSSNTFTSLDCSGSTSTNAYCDQMLESFLGLAVGVPDSSAGPTDTTSPSLSDSNGTIKQMLSQLKVRGKNGSNGPGGQSPSDNPNVTQICCFLMSFPTARENCCNQVLNFCQGVSGIPDSCGSYGSPGGGSYGGSSGRRNGSGHRGGYHGGHGGSTSNGNSGPDYGNY